MFEDMSQDDHIEYLRLDRIIQKGEDGFVEWLAAIIKMRDEKLYRRSYKTFEDYCQKKLSKSRQYINRLIKGVAAVKALPKHLETKVSNLKAASALGSVPEKDQEKVIYEIEKTGKPATAKAIKEKAAEIAQPASQKRAEIRCETGFIIPIKLEPLWNRSGEVKALLKKVSEVKCAVEDALANDDPLYREMKNSFIADAKMLYDALTHAIPYAVCTACNGQITDTCTFCRGSGFLSKQKYLLAPKGTRDMRERGLKK